MTDATWPSGVVTFVVGDVPDSVPLAEAVGALGRAVPEAAHANRGVPVEHGEGNSFILAFGRPSHALACVLDLQRVRSARAERARRRWESFCPAL